MKTLDVSKSIIDGYLQLLENLGPGNKLDLISKLTLSVKSDFATEDIIDEISRSRTLKRRIEKL